MASSFSFFLNSSANITLFAIDRNTSRTAKTTGRPHSLFTWAQVTTWTSTTMAVCIVGTILNCLTLYVSWPRAGDKSGVNLLIFHYIIANLGNCLIHYPIRCIMVQAKQAGYTANLDVCHFIQSFNLINWHVTYLAEAGLSVNRYVALFLPHSYKNFATLPKNVLQIAVIWTVSLAFVLPFNFGVGGYFTILVSGHCANRVQDGLFAQFYNIFKFLPYVINGVALALILWKCYIYGRRIQVSQTAVPGGPAVATPVARHRILLAKLLVFTYLWTVLYLIPPNAIIAIDPMLFERVPMVNLWTAVIAQYAFAPCILLVSHPKYLDRLRRLTRRIVPIAVLRHKRACNKTGLMVARPWAHSHSAPKAGDSNSLGQSIA